MYKSICLTVVDLDVQTSMQAKDITKQGHPKSGYPSFYDSVYHALAIEHNCDFITADGKHEGKVKELGHIKVLKEMNI
jgi:predicted nucleic acid-binding protein